MAVSLAELIITCLLVDWIFKKIKIPGLIGMLLIGIALGPFVLGVINENLLAVSADLRLIALIVILLRAGFELSKDTLSRVGLMALTLSFVPACFEIATITLLGPYFLGLTTMESAMLGAILGAVSPAVVVPLMIQFIEDRRGAEKGIPTLVLAASSIDDVFVIVVYTIFIGIYLGHDVSIAWQLAGIPLSITSGILVGLVTGWLLYKLFDRYNPRATKRVLMIVGIAILLVRGEHLFENILPFSALIAVMAVGFIILEKREHYAHEMSAKLGKIWIFAEILLFTLVGSQVDVSVAFGSGLAGIALISLGLVGRSIGTYVCMLGSNLNLRERLFVVIAYLPKATVQAAIGAAPLAAMKLAGMDTAAGDMILTVAVLSILYTAPLGAWAISSVGGRVLEVAPEEIDDSRKAAIESEANVDGGLLP
jgi:NhaP-type Na+/H+ or K+/H+ antiporter